MNREKAIKWGFKTLMFFFTGGVGLNFAGVSAWFGQLLLRSYAAAHTLNIPSDDLITADLYGFWSRKIFIDPATQAQGIGAAVVIAALLLLIIHVLYRQAVARARAQLAHNPAALRAVEKFHAIKVLYRKYYFTITFAVVTLIVLSLARESDKNWLVSSFLLLVIPVAIYLVFYSEDMLRGRFGEQACYMCLAVFFVISVVLLPNRYGRNAFELDVYPVVSRDGKPQPDNVVAIDRRHDLMLLATVALDDPDSLRFTLDTVRQGVVPGHGVELGKGEPLTQWRSEYKRGQHRRVQDDSRPALP